MLNPNSTVKKCQIDHDGKTYTVLYDTRFIFPDTKTGRHVGPGYLVNEGLNCTMDFGPIREGEKPEGPVSITEIRQG